MRIKYTNGSITPDNLVRNLCLTGDLKTVAKNMVALDEARRFCTENGIECSDQAIQEYADGFRKKKDLYTAEETAAFLDSIGVSEDQFEEFCEGSVMVEQMRQAIAPPEKVREFFLTHRNLFETAVLYTITVGSEDLANELMMQIREEDADFHALARKHSVDDAAPAGGYTGRLTRKALSEEMAAKVFNSSPGDAIGPFSTDDSPPLYRIALVGSVSPAELDERTVDSIKTHLLAERINDALKDGLVFSET